MDGGKLKNLAISQLPIVATTPSSAAFVEDVPPLPLAFDVDGFGSPIQPTPSESGYFLRSGKKIHYGGLGKDSLPVSCGRGRKSFLAKAQSRAQKDMTEGKQLSIERALRALQAQRKGHR